MPCDYPPGNLEEEEYVLCADIAAEKLRERNLCIWREKDTARLFVARFSTVRPEPIHIDDQGEYWLNKIAIQISPGKAEAEYKPIGRILGRPLAPIR